MASAVGKPPGTNPGVLRSSNPKVATIRSSCHWPFTEAVIDDKIRRLLRLAAAFGWLDHAQQDERIPLDNPNSRQVALDLAREGCVLLKNDNLLPVNSADLKR
ncbi:MAG: hypothetical protein ACOCXA_07685, partial [Planctomycetota bacterium]